MAEDRSDLRKSFTTSGDGTLKGFFVAGGIMNVHMIFQLSFRTEKLVTIGTF